MLTSEVMPIAEANAKIRAQEIPEITLQGDALASLEVRLRDRIEVATDVGIGNRSDSLVIPDHEHAPQVVVKHVVH